MGEKELASGGTPVDDNVAYGTEEMIYRAVWGGMLLAAICGSAGTAGPPANVCQVVANEIRAKLMTVQSNEQGPLEALAALGDTAIQLVKENPAGWASATEQAARFGAQHSATETLTHAVQALGDNVNLIQLPGSPIWMFDGSGGSLGCHILVAAWAPNGATAQRIDLPFGNVEGDLCGATIKAARVGGHPVLIAEEGSGNDGFASSNLTIATFDDGKAGPTCEVEVRYSIGFRAEHAFCKEGVDCGEILHRAEGFAAALRAGTDPATTAIPVGEDVEGKLRVGYERMQQTDGQTENLDIVPSFNKFEQVTGADQFASDEELFPFRIGSGDSYLGRLGHGYKGVIESAGYIFAAYGLNGPFGVSGDRTIPVAGVSIEPHLEGIKAVEVK